MLTESATVVALDQDFIWVEARRQSQCNACTAQSSCGHGLLGKLHKQRPGLIKVQVSDSRLLAALHPSVRVTLGMAESLVLHLSFLFYLLPLVGLVCASMLASQLMLSELLIIAAGCTGLGVGFALVKRLADSYLIPGVQVVLLGVEGNGPDQGQEAAQRLTITSMEHTDHVGIS